MVWDRKKGRPWATVGKAYQGWMAKCKDFFSGMDKITLFKSINGMEFVIVIFLVGLDTRCRWWPGQVASGSFIRHSGQRLADPAACLAGVSGPGPCFSMSEDCACKAARAPLGRSVRPSHVPSANALPALWKTRTSSTSPSSMAPGKGAGENEVVENGTVLGMGPGKVWQGTSGSQAPSRIKKRVAGATLETLEQACNLRT